MPSPIDLRNPSRPIHVGVVLLNSTTEMLDIAPVGFFSSISRSFLKDFPASLCPDELKAQAPDFVFHWITETGETPASLTGSMSVVPTHSFITCPQLDIILLGAAQFSYRASETELAFLRKTHESCAALLCVCGGFEPVLSAGLLEGKTATAPRQLLPMLRGTAPGTNWVDKRYVNDGKVWTTGVLLNGLDMVVAFARSVWGGKGLVEMAAAFGNWPERDVEYRDDDAKSH
ncbi:class I glutamine amidotransferase-like protein [Aspergillus undulatus]|uniref:class I glutamine amidotransferase-like protein n=1 Tax=Aspergillus undulatus TaxID=1810928 RepID=UPI003CCE4961